MKSILATVFKNAKAIISNKHW